MKLLFVALSIIFYCSCSAQPKPIYNKNNNSLLWEVSGNGLKEPSYLFGTFHLMFKDDILFSTQLTNVFANVDKVYMEMDMDDPAILMGGVLLMNMKNGTTLEQLYSAAAYKKVSSYFSDSLHLPLAFIQQIKPFFLEALLFPKMMPCKSISGVEEELVKMAKLKKKEIRGLETMDFQAAVFDSIPYQKQAIELLKAIDSMAVYQSEFDAMTAVYKNQQLAAMENLFNTTSFGRQDHQDLLLYDRNNNWVQQLKLIMPQTKVFVAVGAAHLIGKKGLIALLRKQGFSVKPLLNL